MWEESCLSALLLLAPICMCTATYLLGYVKLAIIVLHTLNRLVEAIDNSSTISASVKTSSMLTYEDRYGFTYANTAT